MARATAGAVVESDCAVRLHDEPFDEDGTAAVNLTEGAWRVTLGVRPRGGTGKVCDPLGRRHHDECVADCWAW